jgi:Caspase domain
MARIALLIGVSEYGTGLTPLPCATKDVTALQQLLEDKEIGKFDEVRTLQNPDTQTMARTIEKLFKEREKEDFVLLFFSGHGIQDDSNRLFFAAHNTQKHGGKVYESETVSASFVHSQMEGSRCRQMVVILNCCFSGAFSSDLIPRNVGIADVKAQLGGRGRAIMTSCNAVQLSFEEKGADLSIYSQYLVEGLKTGEADQDRNGRITVDELHNYVREKVENSRFAMSPEIHLAMKEPLTIAYTPMQDKSKRYEDTVMLFAQQGSISKTCHKILEGMREKLALSDKEARAIESTVLKSQKKYWKNLYLYRQEFLAIARRSPGVIERNRHLLVRLQQGLDLSSKDVAWIEAAVLQKLDDSKDWRSRLKWTTLIFMIPVAIASDITVGIYFRAYDKLPSSIQDPIAPLLNDSHDYLHKTVSELRQRLAIQIIDSETTQVWTIHQMSQIQKVIDKAVAAEKLAEEAQAQAEWLKAEPLWKKAIDEWKAASQLLAVANWEAQSPAFMPSFRQYLDVERQKAESELDFGAAVNTATLAANQAKIAKKREEWSAIAFLWQQSQAQMQAVRPVSHHYQLAQAKATVYVANQQEAQKQVNSLSRSTVNK